jgi:hypothetical protein
MENKVNVNYLVSKTDKLWKREEKLCCNSFKI